MEIVLYNCPHCNTRNVILTQDNLCPNCKHKLTDENRQPPNALSNSEIDENGVNNTETVNKANVSYERPWDEKPLWTIIKNSIIFLGVILLLISPVVFLYTARGSQHGMVSGDVTIKSIHWTLKFIFFGWLISEIGLITAKISRVVKIFVRISIYTYILIGLVLLGIVYFIIETFSHMPPP
jgi:hypothetical protein